MTLPILFLQQAKYFLKSSRDKISNISLKNRPKRGLINVMGKTSQFLFGILDTENEERCQIKLLQKNQNSLKYEIKLSDLS